VRRLDGRRRDARRLGSAETCMETERVRRPATRAHDDEREVSTTAKAERKRRRSALTRGGGEGALGHARSEAERRRLRTRLLRRCMRRGERLSCRGDAARTRARRCRDDAFKARARACGSCRSGFTTLPPVSLQEQYHCGSFVGGAQIAQGVGYQGIWWTQRFTWFGPPERNTLRPWVNGVVLLCLSARL
jgi:hypothetical protein